MYHITKRIGHKVDISLLTVADESGTKYRVQEGLILKI